MLSIKKYSLISIAFLLFMLLLCTSSCSNQKSLTALVIEKYNNQNIKQVNNLEHYKQEYKKNFLSCITYTWYGYITHDSTKISSNQNSIMQLYNNKKINLKFDVNTDYTYLTNDYVCYYYASMTITFNYEMDITGDFFSQFPSSTLHVKKNESLQFLRILNNVQYNVVVNQDNTTIVETYINNNPIDFDNTLLLFYYSNNQQTNIFAEHESTCNNGTLVNSLHYFL